MPYRDAPPLAGSRPCEVCGEQAETVRCDSCHALAGHLTELEIPVVLCAYSWSLGDPDSGVGLVLVDRWREVAYCACQAPNPGSRAMETIARTRASLWAPTATIVSLDQTDDWDSALLETLRRVPGEWHHLVRGCFDSAASRARQLADGFRDRVRVGTRLAPPPPPVAP